MNLSTCQSRIQDLFTELPQFFTDLNFFGAAEQVMSVLQEIGDILLLLSLNKLLSCKDFLKRLRKFGGARALKLVGYREIKVQFPGGHHFSIKSPYFVKSAPSGRSKRGPKRQGHNRKGSHLALELLGFFDKVCPNLSFRALKLGVLCPSFEIASRMLRSEGIILSVNKLRSLFGKFDCLDDESRSGLITSVQESFQGQNIILCVDGGRYRMRVDKKGRLPKNAKRRGYETPWKEPRLFTLYCVDDQGRPLKKFKPLTDGSTGEMVDFLSLLRSHLQKLQVHKAKRLTLVCDGAPWVWKRIPPLLKEIGVDQVTELIDSTHAKQNLAEAFAMTRYEFEFQQEKTWKQAVKLLFQGRVSELKTFLGQFAAKGKIRALRDKMNSYFCSQPLRFQYSKAKERGLVIGSGAVESAIRRVLNLRIKAPGSFWKKERAETMIFLRSAMLYGRWGNLVDNFMKRRKNGML